MKKIQRTQILIIQLGCAVLSIIGLTAKEPEFCAFFFIAFIISLPLKP